MPTVNAERYSRARASLEGLSVGDAFGERWFNTRQDVPLFQLIEDRRLPPRPWIFTDDTQMSLSIVSILRQYDGIDQDQLALNFANHFDHSRGYGLAMYSLLPEIGSGVYWKDAAKHLFGGLGSFGNGASMRVAPLGAYFADDLDAVVEHARRSAEVTHTHPEGIAGAIAVAVAAAYAWRLRGSTPTRQEFLDKIVPLIPDSEVKTRVGHARDLIRNVSLRFVIAALGNGSAITAQDTVGFTVWCAGEQLGNYEEALWLCASGGGDVDTTCAIVGGIVASHTGIAGIPAPWISNREKLPDWPFQDG